jgi:nucleoid DNA-binding protein
MSRCVLHVGMHKTGTSSIQQSLNGFADERHLYANITGHPNHSRAIFEALGFQPGERGAAGGAKGGAANRGRSADPAALARLSRSIDDARGRTWVVSGEGMSLLPPAALRRLHDFLRPRFDQVTIAAAVRAPAGYMASAFQEPIKQGARDNLNLARRYRSYRRTFEKFDEVFGRENVELWKFDPRSFPEGCAVRDFCRRLGIAIPVERIVRVNESLSREAMGLLFSYRKLGRDLGAMSMSGPQNTGLVDRLMKIGRRRFRFSPDAVRPVLDENRADIEWMEARLGASLHEELGEHQAGDVRGEADLLAPDPGAVAELLAALGDRAPAGVRGETPREVALLVHALRGEGVPVSTAGGAAAAAPAAAERMTGGASPKRGDSEMNVTELIEDVRRKNPKLLEGISQEQAEALVRNVFRQVSETLAATEEGVIKYPGLGQFRVRKVEREVDGEKVTRTQIMFRRAEPGPGRNAE